MPLGGYRAPFVELYEFDRGIILTYRYCGLLFRGISQRAGRNQTTVMQEEMVSRSHPPHCTTVCENEWTVCMAEMHRAATPRTIAQQIQSVKHQPLSPRTIRLRLQQNGMSASVTSVAAEFGIADSIVSRLWRQFKTTGTAIRGFSSGRPRGTTPADDRYIVLQARRNSRQTAGEIARHTTQATGRPISRFTVARRLHSGGLFARRPMRADSVRVATLSAYSSGESGKAAIIPGTSLKGTEKIELREDLKSRRGLAVSLEIICHHCGEPTSGAAARIFCGLMNLPPPPAKFERHNSLFLNVLKTISEDSMNAAVHEAVIANDNNSNIAVAVDGTWHKRGYSSLNGIVCATSVENGKVIDFEALTKYCSSCKGKKKTM
ncbi:transposable element Tcb1 transposase [Trichonephila clavipes]|nr:transposable element Tcb1 transposase [Trichonephila clavipes]